MTKLKPCPFCGGKAETDYGNDYNCGLLGHTWTVSCSKCGVSKVCNKTEEDAIKEWNRRIK